MSTEATGEEGRSTDGAEKGRDGAGQSREDRRPDRLELPDPVLGGRVIAVLPDVGVADLMAPLEVMIQEQIGAFSLPSGDLQRLHEVMAVFGSRACFGVHGAMGSGDVAELSAGGVAFALPVGPEPRTLAKLRSVRIPAAPDAFTPTEVRAVWAEGADLVQVAPAEMAPAGYAQTLSELAPGARLVPRGGLGSYALRQWLVAGAPAACLDEILVGDACQEGSMPSLRERCRSVRAIVADAED